MLDLGAVPCLRPGVLLEVSGEQNYLYDSETYSYALLDNSVAVEIIQRCDGVNSVGRICEEISLLYEMTLTQIRGDVLAMLAMLIEESFLMPAVNDAQDS